MSKPSDTEARFRAAAAKRILVLDGGTIIDEGTHDELIAKGGRYAELAKLQFRNGNEG